MTIKNIKLESKLKEAQKELEHLKSLLQGFISEKENHSKSELSIVSHSTPQTSRGNDDESKLAPRKSIKHVSFAEDRARTSIQSKQDESKELESKPQSNSILKPSSKFKEIDYKETPQKHNIPKSTKETKGLSKEGEYSVANIDGSAENSKSKDFEMSFLKQSKESVIPKTPEHQSAEKSNRSGENSNFTFR